MKKLLLILLCVPLLFTTCKKEDDTLGTGNFLENQDGSVWLVQIPIPQSDTWLGEKIGFYNENNFLCNKTIGVWANCFYYYETASEGYTLTILSNTNNEFSFTVNIIDSSSYLTPQDYSSLSFKFTTSSPTSNQMNLEVHIGEYYNSILHTEAYAYASYNRSSTETNLSCP